MVAPNRGRVADVAERRRVFVVEEIGIRTREVAQALVRARRDRQDLHLAVVRTASRRTTRRLRQNRVCVRTAKPERVHAGNAEPVRGGPLLQLGHDAQPHFVEGDRRVRLGEVEARWNAAMLQGERRLDHTRDACSSLEVADVPLDRPDQARAVGRASLAVDGSDRVGLPRVARRRARPVRLDVVHLRWRHSRISQGAPQQRLLRRRVGDADTRRPAVLVDGGRPDDGADRISRLERLRQRLEDDSAGALAADVPVRVRGERTAAAVGGQH